MRPHVRHTTPSRFRRGLAVGAALVLMTACGGDDTESAVEDAADELSEEASDVAASAEEQSQQLATMLRDRGLSSVASAVELVDFTEIVDAPDFTFFAPDDEAFQTLTADEMADLLSRRAGSATAWRSRRRPARRSPSRSTATRSWSVRPRSWKPMST